MEQGFKRFGSYAINLANIAYVENRKDVQYDVFFVGGVEPLRVNKDHPAFASLEHWWRQINSARAIPLSDS